MLTFLPALSLLMSPACIPIADPKDDDSRDAPDIATTDGTDDTGETTTTGPGPGPGPGDTDTGGTTTGPGPTDTSPIDTETDPVDTETTEPTDTAPVARAPVWGEIAFTELMINPAEISDAEGEWVELLNLSDDWLTLDAHYLADDNKDSSPIHSETGLAFGPGERLIICASADMDLNGGVECDGLFEYSSFGDGFVLANGGDEVWLLNATGEELDRVAYGKDWAASGAAMGVRSLYATPDGNDNTRKWCAQTSSLAGGDFGTPGVENDDCG